MYLCLNRFFVFDEVTNNGTDDGWQQPAEAQSAQRQSNEEVTHHTEADQNFADAADCCDQSAQSNSPQADLVTEEAQTDQNHNRWIQDAQYRRSQRNDGFGADTGNCCGEDANCSNQCFVVDSAAGNGVEVVCSGAGQRDCGGQTSHANNDCEEDNANFTRHQILDQVDQQLSAVNRGVVDGGYGSAQEGQTAVNDEQTNTCHDGSTQRNFGLGSSIVMTFGSNGVQDQRTEDGGSQNVHGLIAGLNTGCKDGINHRSSVGRTQRIDDTQSDEHKKTNEEDRSQNLTNDVNNGRLIQTEQQDQTEEENVEDRTGDHISQRKDGQLVGCCGGTRDRDEWAKTENDQRHNDDAQFAAERSHNRFMTASADQSEHTNQSQTDVSDVITSETADPLCTGLQTQIWWEDHVASSEEHGEEGSANDDRVYDGFFRVFFHFQLTSLSVTYIILFVSTNLPLRANYHYILYRKRFTVSTNFTIACVDFTKS